MKTYWERALRTTLRRSCYRWRVKCWRRRCAIPAKTASVEVRLLRKDGVALDAEATGRNLLADPDVGGIVVTARDITERKKAEAVLHRVNRALRTLSAGNEALVRARDETALLTDMMRILHDVGGYEIAFVSYALNDAAFSIDRKASAGIDLDALAKIQASWGDNGFGQSMSARAIRLGRTQIVRDPVSDPGHAAWRDLLQTRNIRSLLGLPLRLAIGEQPFGAIGIAATAADAFDLDELKLLEELAGDLGYGISNLRNEHARRLATEKLQRRSEERRVGKE